MRVSIDQKAPPLPSFSVTTAGVWTPPSNVYLLWMASKQNTREHTETIMTSRCIPLLPARLSLCYLQRVRPPTPSIADCLQFHAETQTIVDEYSPGVTNRFPDSSAESGTLAASQASTRQAQTDRVASDGLLLAKF